MVQTDIVARLAEAADYPRLLDILKAGWPGSNGYHSSVADRWVKEWPAMLKDFDAHVLVEAAGVLVGFAGIQFHEISYTGGLKRALADHFLSRAWPRSEALGLLVRGLAGWARGRGASRLTLNMEPGEYQELEALRAAGMFPERAAMFTFDFPTEPLDPRVREMRPEERSQVVEMGARIAEFLSGFRGSLCALDFPELVSLTDKAYREYGATRPYRFFVAERDGRLVGFCFAVVEPPEGGLIYDLYVDPAYRRHGISRQLYAHACAWLQEQGAQWLTLSVYVDNEPAYKAYEKWGFFPYFIAWELNL